MVSGDEQREMIQRNFEELGGMKEMITGVTPPPTAPPLKLRGGEGGVMISGEEQREMIQRNFEELGGMKEMITGVTPPPSAPPLKIRGGEGEL